MKEPKGQSFSLSGYILQGSTAEYHRLDPSCGLPILLLSDIPRKDSMRQKTVLSFVCFH